MMLHGIVYSIALLLIIQVVAGQDYNYEYDYDYATDPQSSTAAPGQGGQSTNSQTTTAAAAAPTTTMPAATTNAHANPADNQWCPTNSGMNDRIRKQALDAHNWRRSLLAKGNVAKRNGKRMPRAANMMKLVYDCNLENAAKNRAMSCVTTTNPDTSIQENLYVLPRSKAVDRPDAMRQSVSAWWKKVRTHDPIGDRLTFNTKHQSTAVRSFTRMAWATTNRIGCAVRGCGQNWHAVCHYSPPGNILNSLIYQKGKPCNACPTNCDSALGLCMA